MRKRNPNVIVSSKHSIEFCSVAKTGELIILFMLKWT